MGTSPQLGGSAYNAAIARIQAAQTEQRRCLGRLIEDPGPQTRQVLLSQMAFTLIDSSAALKELEAIGRNAKDLRKAETE